jgi:hypothetical protein
MISISESAAGAGVRLNLNWSLVLSGTHLLVILVCTLDMLQQGLIGNLFLLVDGILQLSGVHR